MRKGIILLILAVLNSAFLIAQQKKIIYRADSARYDEDFLPGVERLIGNVVFSHDKTIGYCDSAHFYSNLNQIVAFGKIVRIHANDSVTLYGKRVFYDGNIKVASIAQNVILMDPSSTLYTDSLTYEMSNNLAYYVVGGKMVNDETTVTSREGHYYTQTNEVILNHNVHLVNNDYTMDCASLKYNTQSKIVYFTSRTRLVTKEDSSVMMTSGGWYDTEQDISNLYGDVEIHKKPQMVTGDSIFYDKNLGFAIGRHHVRVADTAKDYILQGNYVEYYENGGMSTATDSAMLILIDESKDSLYLHADTLNILIDSLQEPQLMLAYNHVKFYRADMQGACDSMVYISSDSILTLYYNPVIWSDENQLTADTIRFRFLSDDQMRVDFLKSGFITSSLFDETEFNQIKGVNIVGYIRDKKLYQVDVINNAECLYYILEEDTSLVGINYSVTSEMTVFLEDNKVKTITLYNNPDGKIYADNELSKEDKILKDFRWLRSYRPLSVLDIFHTPMPRYKQAQLNNAPPPNPPPDQEE
jgi:lipopolysaccharide export system protein LptA